MTIGADGLGLISYFDETNDDLKVAHCSNTNCTAATITSLTTGKLWVLDRLVFRKMLMKHQMPINFLKVVRTIAPRPRM